MTYRNIIKQLLTISILSFCILSCDNKDNKLRIYYESNSKLHQELSDSLMNFCKIYNTDVRLHKINDPEKNISFEIHFHDSAELLPVYFDSSFIRHDSKPSRTVSFIIPVTLIEKFKSSIYFGVGSDSTYTFFAYEWDKPKNWIGTSGDSQYGILVLKDTDKLIEADKRISKNACITSYGVF